MKFEERIDLYSDEGKVLAEKIPIEALSPLRNPYMGEIYVTMKKTVVVDLKKLERMLREGECGWGTLVGQDEVKMPWYGFEIDLVENANEIASELKKSLQIKEGDDTTVLVLEDGNTFIVQLSEEVIRRSGDWSAAFAMTSVALGQIISKMANLSPLENPHRLGILKNCLWGRYPQATTPQPSNPVAPLLKYPSAIEGIGVGLKSIMINHLVALANNRTLQGVALTTILEQGGETEMGDCVGWYERNQLLASAYQGFNANNLVLDLIKENRNGTVADVIESLMRRAYEDGVIHKMGDSYPYVQPSGYVLWGMRDFPTWNAYACAALLAATIVNSGATRSAQAASSVFAYFNDMLAFAAGGLPDPDSGRVMGTGVGFQFYTHGIYGGAGPGAFTLEHVITRSTSGFLTPCATAGMCLDAGTQIFKPTTTSGLYYTLADHLPIFKNPMEKAAEAAENIKNDV